MKRIVLLVSAVVQLTALSNARAFTHPGIPLTTQDLDTVRSNINRGPWKSGYAALAGDSHSQLSYSMQGPFAHVGRNEGGTNPNLTQWRNDMIAVWNLSRMWYFTQDTRYAQKAQLLDRCWEDLSVGTFRHASRRIVDHHAG